MVVWTDKNTAMNPCPSNMDGKNTPFNFEKDVLSLTRKTAYGFEGELVSAISEDTNLTVYMGKGIPPEKLLKTLKNNGYKTSISWKFESGSPPPPSSIPFEHVGEPVFCPDGDYKAVVAQLGWTCWATHRENGHCWVVRQEGTDRYWVDAGEGGASVPGAAENVFFNDKATEDGVWNAVTNWAAATGTAVGDAYVCTMDVNSAALGTFTMSYASATLAVVSYTLEHDGAGAISAGTVSVTTGKWQADGALTLSGGTFLSNTAHTLDVNANYTLSGATHNAPSATGAFTCASTTFTQSSGTYNNDSGLVTMDRAGTTTLGSAATAFWAVKVSNGTTFNTGNYNFSVNVTGSIALFGLHIAGTGNVQLGSSIVNLCSGWTYYNALWVESDSGTLNCGSATITCGGVVNVRGPNITMSSGITTFNGYALANGNLSFGITTNSPNYNGGTLSFTYAGQQLISHNANTAQTFINLIVNNASCVLKFQNAKGFNLTCTTVTITSGQFSTVEITSGTSRGLTVSGGTSVSGTLTCNASTTSLGSGLTGVTFAVDIASGGTLTGGTGAHTYGNIRVQNGGAWSATSNTTTVNSYQSGGSYIVWNPTSTMTHNNGTITTTSTTSALIEAYKDITVYSYIKAGSSTASLYTTSTIKTWAVAGDLTISAGTLETQTGASLHMTLAISGSASITGTLSCKDSIVTAVSVTVNNGGLLSIATADMGMTGNLVVGGGASGSVTFSATGDLEIDGTTTINTGATLGSATTAYVLNMDGSLLASTGTLIAPTGANWTFAGAVFNTPTVLTNSSGTIAFDITGTSTLGNTSTSFSAVTISAGATLDTSAASNYALTTSGAFTITGSSTCNASACSFGSVTFGAGSPVWNMTSGTTTVSSESATGYALDNTLDTGEINSHNGTLTITTPATTKLHVGTDIVLYDLVLNNASLTLHNEMLCVVDHNLTITAGTFNLKNEAASTSYTLTVSGTASVSGTFLGAGATVTQGGAVTINASGAYTFSTATTTIGTSFANAGTTTVGNGSTIAGSASGKVITSTGTWTWDSCTLSNLDIQFNITTPGATDTITFSSACIIDNLTITSSDAVVINAGIGIVRSGNISYRGTSGIRMLSGASIRKA